MKNNIRLISLLVLLGFNTVSFANNFKIESFKADPEDQDAQLFGRKDNTNQNCAMIKILTDIEGLTFEASKSVVGAVVYMPGEYWLYVPGGEQQIRIIKEGFTTLEVNCVAYKINIESGKVYVMNLKSEASSKVLSNTNERKGDILITSNPSGAYVTLEGEDLYRGVTPLLIKQHPAGEFKIAIEKENFNTVNTVFRVIADSVSKMFVHLNPNVGFIKFKINPPSPTSNVYLDDKMIQGLKEGELYPVSRGKHSVMVYSDSYTTEKRDLTLDFGDIDSVFVRLKPIVGRLIVNVNVLGKEKPEIWINEEKTEHFAPSAFPLLIGDKTVSLKLKGYPVSTKNITLKKDENLTLDFKMRSFEEIKHQVNVHLLKQNIWMASTLGSGAIGLFLIMDSNKKNQAYKTATGSDANTLHAQIESNRKTAVTALGIAAFSAIEFSIQIIKKEKDKHWLRVESDGQSVGLKANF